MLEAAPRERAHLPGGSTATSAAGSGTPPRGPYPPVAQPQYDYELPTADDSDWQHGDRVQPKVDVVDWTQLEVGRPEGRGARGARRPGARRAARVGRGARPRRRPPGPRGRHAFGRHRLQRRGGAARHVVELGSGRLVDEVEAALVGAVRRDEERQLRARGRVDLVGRDHRQGDQREGAAELDDDLARSASEFDTLDELRADIERRLREAVDAEIENAFRANAVDALVAASKVGPPARSSSRGRSTSPASSARSSGADRTRDVPAADRPLGRGADEARCRWRPLSRSPASWHRGGRRQARDRGLGRRGQAADP